MSVYGHSTERRHIKQKGRWHSLTKERRKKLLQRKASAAERSNQKNLDLSPNVGEFSLNLANSPLSEKLVFTENKHFIIEYMIEYEDTQKSVKREGCSGLKGAYN